MNENTQQLMKHFASVLRKRASQKQLTKSIHHGLKYYLSRKELIAIISRKHDGIIPEEYNLAELENDGLLQLIGDELYVMAYVAEQWSKEAVVATTPAPTVASPATTSAPLLKTTGVPVVKNETKEAKETPKKSGEKNK